jgi:hypothetical protein
LAEELTRAVDRAGAVHEVPRAEDAVDARERVEGAGEELILCVNVTDESESQNVAPLLFFYRRNVAGRGSITHLTTYHFISDLNGLSSFPLSPQNS